MNDFYNTYPREKVHHIGTMSEKYFQSESEAAATDVDVRKKVLADAEANVVEAKSVVEQWEGKKEATQNDFEAAIKAVDKETNQTVSGLQDEINAIQDKITKAKEEGSSKKKLITLQNSSDKKYLHESLRRSVNNQQLHVRVRDTTLENLKNATEKKKVFDMYQQPRSEGIEKPYATFQQTDIKEVRNDLQLPTVKDVFNLTYREGLNKLRLMHQLGFPGVELHKGSATKRDIQERLLMLLEYADDKGSISPYNARRRSLGPPDQDGEPDRKKSCQSLG